MRRFYFSGFDTFRILDKACRADRRRGFYSETEMQRKLQTENYRAADYYQPRESGFDGYRYLLQKELQECLAIAPLTARQRRFTGYFLSNLTIREIAVIELISPTRAHQVMQQMLQILRKTYFSLPNAGIATVYRKETSRGQRG